MYIFASEETLLLRTFPREGKPAPLRWGWDRGSWAEKIIEINPKYIIKTPYKFI